MMATQRPTQRQQSNVIVKLMNNTDSRLDATIVCKRYSVLVQTAQRGLDIKEEHQSFRLLAALLRNLSGENNQTFIGTVTCAY